MDEFDQIEYSKNFDWSIWRKLAFYIKLYKGIVIITIFSLLVLAFIDAFYPILTMIVIDEFVVMNKFDGISKYIILFIVLTITQSIMAFIFVFLNGSIEAGLVYSIRKDCFEKIQRLSISYFDNHSVGRIMSTVSSDISKIGDVVAWNCIELTWSIAVIIIVIINMFILNIWLALIVIVVMPVISVIIKYFEKKVLKQQRKVRNINAQITGVINEGINGVKTTKSLVREQLNQEEFTELTMKMKLASVRSFMISSVFTPIVLFIGSISIAFIIFAGVDGVTKQNISFGTLTVFVTYATLIFEPIQRIVGIIAVMQSAQASAERVFTLIDTNIDIVDKEEIVKKYGDYLNPKVKYWPKVIGDVKFENVSFYYNSSEKILDNFCLHVRAGQKIALVGTTGAGKTTIVNLLCRFYEPKSGIIKIDDMDYKELPLIWLQSNIGYVLQNPFLFNTTIMENIRYGSLNCSDDEVIEAAKVANAYDFIMELKDGFNYIVGEDGSNFSVGQKQLISFARAIIGDKRLILFDEATAYVDTLTEQKIQVAIDNILKNRTSFIVAHRLSTVRTCDRILVIETGKIIEDGTHEQLLKKRGKYFKLYTNQFVEE